jgi:hypothetical protein
MAGWSRPQWAELTIGRSPVGNELLIDASETALLVGLAKG